MAKFKSVEKTKLKNKNPEKRRQNSSSYKKSMRSLFTKMSISISSQRVSVNCSFNYNIIVGIFSCIKKAFIWI